MKQAEKSKITSEKIIESAINEFGSYGYYGASLNRICESGISKGLLYHNFENKDAIYIACVKRCFDTFTAFLENQSVGTDLELYMNARMRFFEDNADMARIFFEAILQPPEQLAADIISVRKKFDDSNNKLYQSMLNTIILRDGVTKEDATDYFILMQTMFNGYFSSPSFNQMPFCEIMACHENRLSKLLDFILYGIAKKEDL